MYEECWRFEHEWEGRPTQPAQVVQYTLSVFCSTFVGVLGKRCTKYYMVQKWESVPRTGRLACRCRPNPHGVEPAVCCSMLLRLVDSGTLENACALASEGDTALVSNTFKVLPTPGTWVYIHLYVHPQTSHWNDIDDPVRSTLFFRS